MRRLRRDRPRRPGWSCARGRPAPSARRPTRTWFWISSPTERTRPVAEVVDGRRGSSLGVVRCASFTRYDTVGEDVGASTPAGSRPGRPSGVGVRDGEVEALQRRAWRTRRRSLRFDTLWRPTLGHVVALRVSKKRLLEARAGGVGRRRLARTRRAGRCRRARRPGVGCEVAVLLDRVDASRKYGVTRTKVVEEARRARLLVVRRAREQRLSSDGDRLLALRGRCRTVDVLAGFLLDVELEPLRRGTGGWCFA